MSTKKRVPRPRLAPDRRRQQLLDVAGRLLTERGEAGLQFTELATAAGVTRPVVYRFFATRQALIAGVLDDFEAELGRRFLAAAQQGVPASLEEAARSFMDAVCDTIETKGAGAWRVLAAGGTDPEAARLGDESRERLVTPWIPLVRRVTKATEREVTTLTRMLVASARAVLELWYDGFLTRAEASAIGARGTAALLDAFTVPKDDSPGEGVARAPPRPHTKHGRASPQR